MSVLPARVAAKATRVPSGLQAGSPLMAPSARSGAPPVPSAAYCTRSAAAPFRTATSSASVTKTRASASAPHGVRAVIVAAPRPSAVTTPAESTTATPGRSELQASGGSMPRGRLISSRSSARRVSRAPGARRTRVRASTSVPEATSTCQVVGSKLGVRSVSAVRPTARAVRRRVAGSNVAMAVSASSQR